MLRLISHLDKAEEKLQLLSHTDELTQIYNRRYFLQFGEQGIMRAKEHNEPFSIAILDLDNFKEINDQYGHLIGDQVLRELSAFSQRKFGIPIFSRAMGAMNSSSCFLRPIVSKVRDGRNEYSKNLQEYRLISTIWACNPHLVSVSRPITAP